MSKVQPAKIVRNCKTAEELLHSLGAENPLWNGNRYFWAFRGHEDDNYKLLPQALRVNPPANLGYSFARKIGRQKTNKLQIAAEFECLHEFYWSADAQGLLIPNDSHLMRTPAGWRQMKRSEAKKGWPPDELLPLAALAQHYGIATRLLDWTQKPLVSAYFAARKAAEFGSPTNHMAVWALNFDWVIHRAWTNDKRKISAFVVTAPRVSNPNLHAQGGIFTTEKLFQEELKRKTNATPLDELVESRYSTMTSEKLPVMVHLRLPQSEAGKLLRLLHRDGIDAATIYPGYRGIADSIMERKYWDNKERVNFWLKEGFNR